MPRTYTRKTAHKYSQEDVEKAINEINNNKNYSINAAAKKYGIPTTTLFDKVKQRHKMKVGRPQVIPFQQELILADGLRILEKWGFGLSRKETLELVAKFVKNNNLKTPFPQNKPGPDWFINFRKRHRLSIKKPQPVEYVRKKMTDPFVIYEYYEMLETTLTDLNLFDKPHLIWNMDETSLCLDPTKTKVVGAINKACSRTTFGSGKENITVLAAASAAGQKLSPLIVFKGSNVWNQWMANTDDFDFELAYAASKKGWMEGPIFVNYLKNILFPAFGDERPVLIIFDGHSTHVTLEVVHLAIQHGITIIKLPPHTSHLLQPLDVAVFKSFKCKWDSKLVEWQRHNIGFKMPKNVFAQTFAQTWQESSPEIIKNGFKKTGIYPFNAQVISEDNYDRDALNRYKAKQCHKGLKNPNSLKTICVDVFNIILQLTHKEQSTINQYHAIAHCSKNKVIPDQQDEEQETLNQQSSEYCSAPDSDKQRTPTEQVDSGFREEIFVTKLSRTDVQNQKFLAKDASELPACLQVRGTEKCEPKIKIISNVKVSFEELLLDKIRQDKKDINQTGKKKRVAKGCEVITARKVVEERERQIKEMESKKLESKSKNKRKTKDNIDIPSKHGKKNKKADKKNKNRKVHGSDSDSLTSISDEMSIYSDFDDYGTLMDEIWEEDFDIEINNTDTDMCHNILAITDLHEICEPNTSNLASNNEHGNTLTKTKNKGVGKKSKGKENGRYLASKDISKTDDNKFISKQHNLKENEIKTVHATQKNTDADLQEINKDKTEKERVMKRREQEVSYNIESIVPNISENKAEATKETYSIGDSILTRYYNRKKWTYYVGFVKDIIQKDGDMFYSVNYLKTIKNPELKFKMTKKIDHDIITELIIVKKINLQKCISNEKEYILTRDSDTLYF